MAARWQTVKVPQCRICTTINHGNAVVAPIMPQRTTPQIAEINSISRALQRRKSLLLSAKIMTSATTPSDHKYPTAEAE